jgi:LysM repeat protein
MELNEGKAKYASVLDLAGKRGVQLTHVHVQDNKLVITGNAPSQEIVNELWTQIKAVDPAFSDLSAQFDVDASLPQPAQAAHSAAEGQKYTVVSGDTLSKIAKHFYGDANKYMKIFEANTDKLDDPNKIQIGQELVIPAA